MSRYLEYYVRLAPGSQVPASYDGTIKPLAYTRWPHDMPSAWSDVAKQFVAHICSNEKEPATYTVECYYAGDEHNVAQVSVERYRAFKCRATVEN